MILDPKTSRKIFELARDQQDELEEVEDDEEDEAQENAKFTLPRTQKVQDEDEDDDLEEYDDEEYEEVEEIVRPPSTIRVSLDRDPSLAGSGRRRPQDIGCAAPRKCGRATDTS